MPLPQNVKRRFHAQIRIEIFVINKDGDICFQVERRARETGGNVHYVSVIRLKHLLSRQT